MYVRTYVRTYVSSRVRTTYILTNMSYLIVAGVLAPLGPDTLTPRGQAQFDWPHSLFRRSILRYGSILKTSKNARKCRKTLENVRNVRNVQKRPKCFREGPRGGNFEWGARRSRAAAVVAAVFV